LRALAGCLSEHGAFSFKLNLNPSPPAAFIPPQSSGLVELLHLLWVRKASPGSSLGQASCAGLQGLLSSWCQTFPDAWMEAASCSAFYSPVGLAGLSTIKLSPLSLLYLVVSLGTFLQAFLDLWRLRVPGTVHFLSWQSPCSLICLLQGTQVTEAQVSLGGWGAAPLVPGGTEDCSCPYTWGFIVGWENSVTAHHLSFFPDLLG
jgi:hypothetical protein